MAMGLTKQGQAVYEKLIAAGNPDKRKIHIPVYREYKITKIYNIKGYDISFTGTIVVDEAYLFHQEEDEDFKSGNVVRISEPLGAA